MEYWVIKSQDGKEVARYSGDDYMCFAMGSRWIIRHRINKEETHVYSYRLKEYYIEIVEIVDGKEIVKKRRDWF